LAAAAAVTAVATAAHALRPVNCIPRPVGSLAQPCVQLGKSILPKTIKLNCLYLKPPKYTKTINSGKIENVEQPLSPTNEEIERKLFEHNKSRTYRRSQRLKIN